MLFMFLSPSAAEIRLALSARVIACATSTGKMSGTSNSMTPLVKSSLSFRAISLSASRKFHFKPTHESKTYIIGHAAREYKERQCQQVRSASGSPH